MRVVAGFVVLAIAVGIVKTVWGEGAPVITSENIVPLTITGTTGFVVVVWAALHYGRQFQLVADWSEDRKRFSVKADRSGRRESARSRATAS